eukprot:GGOE01002200.1.p1 GENE.GGOE01002200.1~~GGOE01002200.1.p1  ORF type:complete len:294 (-),score=62.10 GGOE01002200.1:643-1446(-)
MAGFFFSPAGWRTILVSGAGLVSLAVLRGRHLLSQSRGEALQGVADDLRTVAEAGLTRVAPLASALDGKFGLRERVATVSQVIQQLDSRLALRDKLSPVTASLQAVDQAVTSGRLTATVAMAYTAVTSILQPPAAPPATEKALGTPEPPLDALQSPPPAAEGPSTEDVPTAPMEERAASVPEAAEEAPVPTPAAAAAEPPQPPPVPVAPSAALVQEEDQGEKPAPATVSPEPKPKVAAPRLSPAVEESEGLAYAQAVLRVRLSQQAA